MAAVAKQVRGRALSYLSVRRGRPPASKWKRPQHNRTLGRAVEVRSYYGWIETRYLLRASMNWDLFLKAASTVVAACVAAIQLRSVVVNSRASIKSDLEILKLLGESHPLYGSVRDRVHARIASYYGDSLGRPVAPVHRAVLAAAGLVMAATFGYFSWLITREAWTWTVLATVYLSLGGLGVSLGALFASPQRVARFLEELTFITGRRSSAGAPPT